MNKTEKENNMQCIHLAINQTRDRRKTTVSHWRAFSHCSILSFNV